MKKLSPRHWLGFTLLFVVYVLAGRLGLVLATVNASASPIWAPSGIAIAAVILWDTPAAVVVFLGALVVNLTTSGSIAASITIAAGNTLEALFAAALTRHFAGGRNLCDRAVDILQFAIFGALLATAVAATIGTLALVVNGLAAWPDFAPVWATWWLGDATGALLVAPLLILWLDRPGIRWSRRQALESVLVFTAFIAVGLLDFTPLAPAGISDYPMFLIAMPVVLWAAFRLRRRETATAIFLLACIAVWGTENGLGPFAQFTHAASLVLLQVFMSFTAVIGLVVAAAVDERRRAEVQLAEREQLNRLVIEGASDTILTIDDSNQITYANASAQRLFGYRPDELVGQSLSMLIPERLRQAHLEGFVRYLRTRKRTLAWQGREIVALHKSGRELSVEISIGEQFRGRHLFTGVIRDIGERQRALAAERWLATLVRNSHDAIIGKNLDGIILSWNEAAEDLFGWTAAEAVGRPVTLIYPPDFTAEFQAIMARLRRGDTIGNFETVRIHKDGRRIDISVSISPIDDGSGRIVGASSVARDITEARRARDQIRHLAHHDTLTGLPNRLLFRQHLAEAIAAAERDRRQAAVLFIDLDHFKEVNDTHGHDVGDELLRTVAARLQGCLRTEDRIARLGGDEFVAILSGDTTSRDAVGIAEKILNALQSPFRFSAVELRISASIGVSLFPDDGRDADALLRSADSAMYCAKETGRAQYQCFVPRLHGAVNRRRFLTDEIAVALTRGEFHLEYQPIVDVPSGRILAAEALLRWDAQRLGAVGPSEFIPLAEAAGTILPLGQYVMTEACRQIHAWRTNGHANLRVAVNLSPLEVRRAGVVVWLKRILEQTGLPPDGLELEFSETAWMSLQPGHLAVLRHLRKSGVHLTVDNFGTGQGSLSALRHYPADRVKIDRTFVSGLGRDQDNAAFMRAVVTWAGGRQLDLVPEGIETADQFGLVQAFGCSRAQGFFFAPPLPPARFAELLMKP
ncbi:MAG: EAL domain-containing protein [Planctomycetota bacterium]